MNKYRIKKILAWMLVLAMIQTLISDLSMQVSAATKMTLSSSAVTIAKGMFQTLSVKNASSGDKIKWSSSNKTIATVSSKGVIKGVKDGKVTIKCVVTRSGKSTTLKSTVTVKTPKFSERTYSINKGESISLSLDNKYDGSTYKWSSSDKTIAKVNSNGKVTGGSAGDVVITVKISIPKKNTRTAKTIIKKVTVFVVGTTEVSTQEEINSALAYKSIHRITIKTDKQTKLDIPKGDYSNVELVVDAPNADIINNGVFKTITIKQIASDTWTENAKGNVLILDASAGHIVIPADAGISKIHIINSNSNFKLDVQGKVDKITIDSTSNVDINISGTVGSIDVNDRATLSIGGSSALAITVNVSEGADGSTINSNVKVEVTTVSNTEINLSKGAEGSSVQTNNNDKSVEVTNNTEASVTVSNEEGKSQTVDSGKNATIGGDGEIINSTTSDSSSSTSGDATSSGDLTRKVTSFKTFTAIEAGIVDSELKSVEEIVALLPTEVIGVASDGNVIFPVTSWTNTDNYSIDASTGYYKFTAVLGNPNKICTVKTGVTAHVNVWVKPVAGEITYSYDYDDAYRKFELLSYDKIANALQLKLKYTGDKYVRANVTVSYYDHDGDLIKQATDYNYVDTGRTTTYMMPLPTNSAGVVVDYRSFTINLSLYTQAYNQYTSVIDQLVIGTPTHITVENDMPTYARYSSTVTIQNTGKAEVQNGEMIVYFWKGEEVIGYETIYLIGIIGSETSTKRISWYWDTYGGVEKVVPDKVTAEINYANIDKANDSYLGDSGVITYSYNYDEEYKKFEVVSANSIANSLQLKLKYTGDKYVWANVTVNYYDHNGDLIKQATDNNYVDTGRTTTYIMPLPMNSSGVVVDYRSFTINISLDTQAYNRYTSVIDQLVIGTPTEITVEHDMPTYAICSSTVTIQNTGKAEVQNGEMIVYFWKGEEVIGYETIYLIGIIGSETSTKRISWYWDTYGGVEKVVPDKVTAEINYANIDKANDSYLGDSGVITYSYNYDEEYKKFEVVSANSIANSLQLKLKYTGDKYVWANVTVNYYDHNGDLIKQATDNNYVDTGRTTTYIMPLPMNSSGVVVDYRSFTINISLDTQAYNRYTSVIDQLVIGTPTEITVEHDMPTYAICSSTVTIQNTGKAEVQNGEMIVYFWKGEEIIGYETIYLRGIVGSETSTKRVSWYWDTYGGVEKVVPDGITVEINYANINKTN